MTGSRLGRRNLAGCAALGALTLIAVPAAAGPAMPAGFTQAKHFVLPVIPANSYTGKPLRIITLVQNDGRPRRPATFDNRMIFFGKALARSRWYASASLAYDLGPSGTTASLRLKHMPVISQHLDSSAAIQHKLRAFIDDAHIGKAPKRRTIFVFYIPCVPGTTIDIAKCGASSYHPEITNVGAHDNNFTVGDSMVFVMMPEHRGKLIDLPVNEATTFASHEIIEATTDSPRPGQQGYHLFASDPDAPFDASPWIFNEGGLRANTEVADMANGSRISLRFRDGKHSFTYLYQRFYTPFGAVHRGDPFRPLSPKVYNSVSTKPGWFTVSLSGAGSIDIPFGGWSAGPIGAWKISTSLLQWSGVLEDPNASSPCRQPSLSRSTINNGQAGMLTVKASDDATPGSWCAIRIQSATNDPTGLHNDAFHQWDTGVRFVS